MIEGTVERNGGEGGGDRGGRGRLGMRRGGRVVEGWAENWFAHLSRLLGPARCAVRPTSCISTDAMQST